MPAPRIGKLNFPAGFLNYIYIPRNVVIYNPKLGIILMLFRVFVVVFFLAEYTTDLSWTLQHVTPEGFVSYWASPNWAYYKQTAKKEAQDEMCLSAPDLTYRQGGMDIQPEGCIDLLPGDTWIKGDSSMFVPTYLEDDWIEQTSGTTCAKLKKCCGEGPTSDDLGEGYSCDNHGFKGGVFEQLETRNSLNELMCHCKKSSSFFVRGADGLKITLHPSFIAEFPDHREAGTTTNPSDHVLTLVKFPENSGHEKRKKHHKKHTKETVEAKPDEAVLVELEAEGSRDSPPVHRHGGVAGGAAATAPKIMRRPGKSKLHSETGFSLSPEPLEHAGMTLVEDLQVGSSALHGQSEDHDLYEDLGASSASMVRREDAAAAEVKAAEASRTASWADYFKQGWDKPDETLQATKFQPGEVLEMSLEAWLDHAVLAEGHAGHHPSPLAAMASSSSEFLLDAKNKGVPENEIQGTNHKWPTFRTTGIELNIDLSWMNPRAHALEHNSTVLNIEVLARGGWHTKPQAYHIEPQDPVTGHTKMVLRKFSGVSIRFNSSGQFSYFSFVAVATALSAMIVYVGLPAIIINFCAKNLLGEASSYYYMAADQVVHPKDMALGMCARAVAARQAVGGNMTTSNVKDTLREVFKGNSTFDDAAIEKHLDVLAKMLIKRYGDSNQNVISGGQLADTALSNEPICMDDAAPMWCQDESQSNALSKALETLFVDRGEEDDVSDRTLGAWQDFTIELNRSDEESLGLDIDFSKGTMIVTGIHEGGKIGQWNTENPEKAVLVGDMFVSVNEKSGSVDQMMGECKDTGRLLIALTRKKVQSD